MKKKAIREIGAANLNWLFRHEEIKKNKEAELYQELFYDIVWKQAAVVGVVKSLPFELDTAPVMTQGWAEGKQIVVPKTTKNGLVFHQITAESVFVESAFGVEEPAIEKEIKLSEIDLLIVPGLIFKINGYRVGFGGGYYDRVLKDFQGKSCSLVFSEQIQESWQIEEFDQRVDKLFIR
ncbi:5-formyltetrahydrofolate cyclo-ligase [Enterococcus sp. LJL51]|uniref:5-formyltetrahydrofolate cyclo-ligase n=1 Tax=Enterococcus sp. LJL51 TaxID=3416656 RepID=UPI003CF5335C